MAGYDVSVIVPTFNRAHYIEECLDSLLAQTMPPCEILVIDDGSEDDTAERVIAYGDQVHYVYKENGGKPSAVNLALTMIKGNLVWLFDDDDVALPDAIERRVEVLKQEPLAGFVYGPHFVGSDDGSGRIVRGSLCNIPQYGADVFFIEILKDCFFHLATALVRRECYENIGGFDPALFSGEDYDMQIRLARIARPAFCPYPIFIFRQHSGIRGAKAVRYVGTERDRIFQQYSRMLGKKIWTTLSLGEYLVPCQSEPLNNDMYRQALLQRMRVMSNKGCISEFFEDLQAFLASLSGDRTVSAYETKLIADAICTGYAYEAFEQGRQSYMGMIRNLKKFPSGKIAISALAKGVFRSARRTSGSLRRRLSKINAATCLFLASF